MPGRKSREQQSFPVNIAPNVSSVWVNLSRLGDCRSATRRGRRTCLCNSERSELSCIRQGWIYYPWPIEFSLLDRATRQAVWKTQFQGVDIRKWFPHGKGYEVANTLTCPPDLPSGTYIVALAILDPAGYFPAVRFAISNYYKGGRHPVGLIGIGGPSGGLLPNDFDDPAQDGSLRYSYS